jgi:hypothetical protein
MADPQIMTNPEEPLEERIREAIGVGDYTMANSLWIELGGRLGQELAAGRVPSARLRHTLELIEWCRTAALIGRARSEQQLTQLGVSSRYMAETAAPRQRLLARG